MSSPAWGRFSRHTPILPEASTLYSVTEITPCLGARHFRAIPSESSSVVKDMSLALVDARLERSFTAGDGGE